MGLKIPLLVHVSLGFFLLFMSTLFPKQLNGKEDLPRSLGQIDLLVPLGEVRARLKNLQYRVLREEVSDNAATGVIFAKKPGDNFRSFTYQFHDGKLHIVRAEYDIARVDVDINQLFCGYYKKYGEPAEIWDASPAGFGIEDYAFFWRDAQTELRILYSPAGRDPFGSKRSLLQAISLEIIDRFLLEKRLEEEKRNRPTMMKKRLETWDKWRERGEKVRSQFQCPKAE